MAIDIAFWVFSFLLIGSAIAVVTLRDIFRVSLFLVLCFLTVAGLFVTLSADFLAAIQVLIYVGAISVLIILAIMLTEEVRRGSLFNQFRLPAFIISAIFLGIGTFVFSNTQWSLSDVPPQEPTTSSIALQLFGEGGFILPVEIAATMLLAAILGAIVLIRGRP